MAETYYETAQGDTWDQIAYEYLGSEYYIDELMQANPDLLDIAVFSAGTVLTIPDPDLLEAEEYDEDDDLTNLPDWRTSDLEDESDEDADYEDDPDMIDEDEDEDDADEAETDDSPDDFNETDPV